MTRLAVRWTLRCCSLLGWLAFRTALWQWGTGGIGGVCGLSEVLLYFNYLEEWLTQPANACATPSAWRTVSEKKHICRNARKQTISSLQSHAWYICQYSQSQDTHTHIASKHIIYGSCVSKLCSISSFCFSFPPYPYHPCMVYIYLPLPSFTIKVTTIHVGKYGCIQK